MSWVIISLISRALWAADNIVDKLLRERYLPESFVLALFTGIVSLIISLLIIPFNGLTWIGFKPVLLVMIAGAIQLIAVFAFYQAVAKEEISRVIPLFQLTPPLVLILSFIFLGEVLTVNYYLAFVLILLGGVLISLQRTKRLLRLSQAFWWMFLSSSIYAVQAVIFKSLYANYSFWDLTIYLGFGEFLPTLAIILLITGVRNKFTQSFSELKPAGWLLILLSLIFVAGATLTGLWAIKTGPISLVSVFRGFQSLFVLIYAIFLSIRLPRILKEELGKGVLALKLVAVFLMMVGLYLIYR